MPPLSEPPLPAPSRWPLVLLRLPLLALVAVVALRLALGPPGAALVDLAAGPGLAKLTLGVVHTLLVRLPTLPALLLAALGAGVLLPALRGRAWLLAAAATLAACVGLAAAALAPPARPSLDATASRAVLLGLTLTLLLLNLRPLQADRPLDRALARLAAIPLAEALLPSPVLRLAGAPPLARRLLAPLSAAGLALAWCVADSAADPDAYARAVTAWDPARSAPWAERLAVAPEGVHCEFHDVDVITDPQGRQGAVVVAEGDRRLLWLPLDGSPGDALPLQEPWAPMGGVTLDAETDPQTGWTWFVDGAQQVARARLDPTGRWQRVGAAGPANPPLHHAYTTLVPERRALVLFTVNAAQVHPDPAVGLISLDQPDRLERRILRGPDGQVPPTFREVAWLPPLGRFVLAPAFGDHLWLADPWTGRAEPWLAVPTLEGKLLWVEAHQRLYMSLPDQPWILVIDPVAGRVERRIPTQPGTRALAVDPDRGLLLAGSVLTGLVLVQRVEDGRPVRVIGTVMPMMRDIALVPGTGQALLTTWGALYRLDYAPD